MLNSAVITYIQILRGWEISQLPEDKYATHMCQVTCKLVADKLVAGAFYMGLRAAFESRSSCLISAHLLPAHAFEDVGYELKSA